jgi:hypothetical protein
MTSDHQPKPERRRRAEHLSALSIGDTDLLAAMLRPAIGLIATERTAHRHAHSTSNSRRSSLATAERPDSASDTSTP